MLRRPVLLVLALGVMLGLAVTGPQKKPSLPLLDWEFATACSAKATRGAGVSHGRTSLNVSNTHVIIARNLKRAVMPVDGGG